MPESIINWDDVRKQFPAALRCIYMNAAESSPIPIAVANAAKQNYDEMLNTGITSWSSWEKIISQTRAKVAKLINADPEEIAFTLSTSYGMNIFADIFREGKSQVLTMEDEYPASTIPWIHRGFIINFMQPKDNIYSIDAIKNTITHQTKILVTSHVQYNTGFKQDLDEVGLLCKNLGLILIVNATQSFGAIPIDVKKAHIDFLSMSGYKWAFTGFGIGIIYINKKWFGKISFPLAGSESVQNWYDFDNKTFSLRKDATELEIGTPQVPNIIALHAAISFINNLGVENIKNRIYELNEYLTAGFKERELKIISPPQIKYKSGITVVDIPDAEKIVQKLEQKNIFVSKRNKGLRVTVHIYNSFIDIDNFFKTLDSII